MKKVIILRFPEKTQHFFRILRKSQNFFEKVRILRYFEIIQNFLDFEKKSEFWDFQEKANILRKNSVFCSWQDVWLLRRTGIPPSCDCVTPSLGYQHVKDTVQELVDALDVMTPSILERITDTWILRFIHLHKVI